MRFKTFLEAEITPFKSEHPDFDHIHALIKEHCMDAINGAKNHCQLFRGDKKTPYKSGIYHPSSGERKSQNTSNYYTSLFDTNTENAAWPKRSKSFICSTSFDNAWSYSGETSRNQPFFVFPYDGVKIGNTQRSDIWNTRLHLPEGFNGLQRLKSMNEFFAELLIRRLHHGIDFIPTMSELTSLLKKADPEIIYECMTDELLITREQDHEKAVALFIEKLPSIYSFANMGMALEKPGAISSPASECWFSGTCIMLTRDDADAVYDEFGIERIRA